MRNADLVSTYYREIFRLAKKLLGQHALGVVARARGMPDMTRAASLTREALYTALRPNSRSYFGKADRTSASSLQASN